MHCNEQGHISCSRLPSLVAYASYFHSMLCRCHPSIAAVSNHSFYGGRLLDGCTAADRGPLLPGLPPLLCLDVRGSQQYASGSGSASNQAEARAVVQVTVPACNAGCLWLRFHG